MAFVNIKRTIQNDDLIKDFNRDLKFIQKQFSNYKGPNNSDINTIQDFKKVDSIADVKLIHFARQKLIDSTVKAKDLESTIRFSEQSDTKSRAHRVGDGNDENKKYLRDAGQANQEFVTKIGSDGKAVIVTIEDDPTNVGTYNFSGNTLKKHYELDVAPWIRFGNTDKNKVGPQDRSTQQDRLNAFCGNERKGPGDISDPATTAGKKIADGVKNSSPLVFDLDGDGIELVSLSDSAIGWDIDQDGFRELSGWVQSDDGFLAIDLNGDGKINDHGELFGTQTTDGFTKLAAYDSNYDGVITKKDDGFTKLLIWRDLDQDGHSSAKELFSLKKLGITEIDLSANLVTEQNSGHDVTHVSTYQLEGPDGNDITREVHDVWFQYDDVNSFFERDFDVDLSALLLPELRGYGHLPDLRTTMMEGYTRFETVRSLVAELDRMKFAQIFSNPAKTLDLVRDILFAWAGVDAIEPTSRGRYIDARELHFLETFSAEPFLQRGWSPDPFIFAARDLKEAFQVVLDASFGRLLAQVASHQIYDDPISYDVTKDELSGGTSLDKGRLAEIADMANNNNDPLAVWENLVRMIEFGIGLNKLDTTSTQELDAAITASVQGLDLEAVRQSLGWLSEEGITLIGTQDGDKLTGTIGDDRLLGNYGDDKLKGGLGADTLDGGGGDDVLKGGIGADLIRGSLGADTYRYELGHGVDTYSEQAYDVDVIVLGKNITKKDILLERVSNSDLRILIETQKGAGEILIENQFNQGAGRGIIELLRFADGSEMALDAYSFKLTGTALDDVLWGVGSGGKPKDRIYGGDGNDRLYANAPNFYEFNKNKLYGQQGDDELHGSRGNDVLSGGSGDDYLAGQQGNDVLIGGRGNDEIYDFWGDDIYRFGAGDGADKIRDGQGTGDQIAFAKGIVLEDLQFQRKGNSTLVLEIGGLGDRIEISSQFDNNGGIELLTFQDGTSFELSLAEYSSVGTVGDDTIWGIRTGGSTVDRMFGGDGNDILHASAPNSPDYGVNFLFGEAGNDRLFGGRGADELNGGRGKDYLSGDQGNDVLIGGRGNDEIYGYWGDDTYRFDAGDGKDKLSDGGGAADKLVFGTGIVADDIAYFRSGNSSLVIKVDGGKMGRIEVTSQFDNNGALETLAFSDETELDLTTTEFVTRGTKADDTIWGIRTGGSTVDRMFGGAGNDILYASALNSPDYGVNSLFGETGNDTLYGGRGADELIGGRGKDYLSGDQGNDVLIGGRGNDEMIGGSGEDTFVYDGGKDVIRDFGADRLDLDDALWGEQKMDVSEVLDFATLGLNEIVFDFGDGNILTLEKYSDLDGLEALITII